LEQFQIEASLKFDVKMAESQCKMQVLESHTGTSDWSIN